MQFLSKQRITQTPEINTSPQNIKQYLKPASQNTEQQNNYNIIEKIENVLAQNCFDRDVILHEILKLKQQVNDISQLNDTSEQARKALILEISNERLMNAYLEKSEELYTEEQNTRKLNNQIQTYIFKQSEAQNLLNQQKKQIDNQIQLIYNLQNQIFEKEDLIDNYRQEEQNSQSLVQALNNKITELNELNSQKSQQIRQDYQFIKKLELQQFQHRRKSMFLVCSFGLLLVFILILFSLRCLKQYYLRM
ncbi:Hypothetical_protein [Hexamita inflata]|uniref:Hypothetical_protein n=1 Tax=Hexamita inflata TaxID=28002 RepID=A0ABP1HYD9_9EUKA